MIAKSLLFNIGLGLVPTLVLGASIAAGIDDDRHHRRMFLLVYGLWALTLAMWNWMRSYPVAWIAVWSAFGILALVLVSRLSGTKQGCRPSSARPAGR